MAVDPEPAASQLAAAIASQPGRLEQALTIDLDRAIGTLEPVERLWFVGTGTSQHASELAVRMFRPGRRQLRWSSAADFAGRPPDLGAGDGVVIISHTGTTAFAGRSRQIALEAGAGAVSLTGQGSQWPEAIETVPMERSETYTVSYTAALLVLARLALGLGQACFDEIELPAVPDRVRAALAADLPWEAPPERLTVLIGTGPGAITAREGALKLREGARVLAEGYEAEYLLHGSAVPLGSGDGLIAIQPEDDQFGLAPALAAAARSEGLTVAELREPAGLDPLLAQIPLTVRLQRLACNWAAERRLDPDKVITAGWASDSLWKAGAA